MRSDGDKGRQTTAAPRRRRRVPLFAVYAAASLVPVAALGAVLAVTYRADTNNSAMAEARSQASLLADDVVGPQLGDTRTSGFHPGERRTRDGGGLQPSVR